MESDSAQHPDSPALLWLSIIVHGVTWVLGMVVVAWCARRFKAIASDFGIEVTPLVLVLLSFADWAVQYWPILLSLALIVPGVMDLMAFVTLQSPAARVIWMVAAWLLPVGLTVGAVVTLQSALEALRAELL